MTTETSNFRRRQFSAGFLAKMPGRNRARQRATRAALLASLSWVLGVWGCAPAHASMSSVRIFDDETRVLQDQVVDSGELPSTLRLEALRDEVVAFQVVVSASEGSLNGVEVELNDFVSPLAGSPSIESERFVEHYVTVDERSHSRHQGESLAWFVGARPDGPEYLGPTPDALIPIQNAPPWAPYPLRVESEHNGAVWVDLRVPGDAGRGVHHSTLRIYNRHSPFTPHERELLATVPIEVVVGGARLPYRAVSFFAYYGTQELKSRFGTTDFTQPNAIEQQLWQLLHAHHVDAMAYLVSHQDASRIRSALDGSWFRPSAGYHGPGIGVPPAVVSVGTYSAFKGPTPKKLERLRKLLRAIPDGIEDVFLYASSEDCENPNGPAWEKLLEDRPEFSRVVVGQACHEDPSGQNVGLVLVPASQFDVATAHAAREANKAVWIYNGRLPRTAPMMLDSPLRGWIANAWISASYDVGRWFLWESTFWNDDNRGGQGVTDPFVSAETFHNADGDSCLYDGLLLYPGQQRGVVPESRHRSDQGQVIRGRDVGFPGVLPSMRLKALRRGIQDAALFLLARQVNASAADRVVHKQIPRALSETNRNAPAPWLAEHFGPARAKLRAIIGYGETPVVEREQHGRWLTDARAARFLPSAPSGGPPRQRTSVVVGCVLALLALLGAFGLAVGVRFLPLRRR